MIRRVPHVIALVLLTATCGAEPPTQPDSDAVPQGEKAKANFGTTSEWIRDEFAFEIPWYLDCLDEEVTWSGVGLFESHLVIQKDGSVRENGRVSLAPISTMVGPSGTWVDPKVVNHFSIGNGKGNFHVNERITWTEAGSGAKMDVWTRVHIVVTGAGEVKVLEDTGGATCALR